MRTAAPLAGNSSAVSLRPHSVAMCSGVGCQSLPLLKASVRSYRRVGPSCAEMPLFLAGTEPMALLNFSGPDDILSKDRSI